MRKFSQYVETQMVRQAEEGARFSIDLRLMEIWEKIQESFVHFQLDGVGHNYTPESFLQDLKKL